MTKARALRLSGRQADAILLLMAYPCAGENPESRACLFLFEPAPTESLSSIVPGAYGDDPVFPVASPLVAPVSDAPEDSADTPAAELAAFGSSEFAKVVLRSLWGTPPSLDLEAEADLHTLLADRPTGRDCKLLRSACDISDGGIAVAFGSTHAFQYARPSERLSVDQDQCLMVHPLFGLFAEQASTLLVSTHQSHISAIEKLAGEYSFFVARIGTTWGVAPDLRNLCSTGAALHLCSVNGSAQTLGRIPAGHTPR